MSTETKSISNYPTPMDHRHSRSELSTRLDNSSLASHHMMRRDRILPQEAPSNRLKTLRSLLFRGHKTLGIDPIMVNTPPPHRNHNHDLDSTLSGYHLRSISQSVVNCPTPKKRYEEQEDCVELKSECSVLTSRNYAQAAKPRLNHELKQINSWDDI